MVTRANICKEAPENSCLLPGKLCPCSGMVHFCGYLIRMAYSPAGLSRTIRSGLLSTR
jgi:hypothetical protein